MAYKLQLKRGSSGSLPTGSAGEPLFTTDTNDLYIGTGAANQRFQKYIASGTSSQFLKGDGSLDSNTYYLASNPSSYIALTALTASSPLLYNNTTGVFSIQLGTDSQNGYLSSSDRTTFNNKQDQFTVSSPLSFSGLNITISQASGSVNGFLSSTDWTTFNNKQNTITNPVTGTGTTNYLPKWTSGTAIGNSLVYDNGTNVLIGTTIDGTIGKLQIVGSGGAMVNEDGAGTKVIQIRSNFAGVDPAINVSTNNALLLQTNNTERARFTAGGNLLVNSTTDNGNRLQVTGNGYFSGNVSIANTTSNYRLSAYKTGAGIQDVLELDNVYQQVGVVDGVRLKMRSFVIESSSTYGSPDNTLTIGFPSDNKLTLTQPGSLGLGVTPSAWGSAWKSLDISSESSFSGASGNTRIYHNSFSGVSADIYKSNGGASIYGQTSGQHQWFTAPSGTAGNAITFTQAMTLTANGRLLLGTTTEGTYLLDVNGTGRFSNNVFIEENKIFGLRTSTAEYSIQFRDLDFRLIGSNDSGTQRLFSFGHYTTNDITGTWNSKATINSYTGAATFSSSVTATSFVSSGQVSLYDYINVQNNFPNFTQLSGIRGRAYYQTNYPTSILFGDPTASNNNIITFNVSNTDSTGTEKMRLNGLGNLLVGTTTDSGEKLQVSGTMKVTGNVNAGGLYYATGVIVAAGSSTTTFYTLPNTSNNTVWLISVRQQGASSNNIMGMAFAINSSSSLTRIAFSSSLSMDFTVSGLALQLVLGAGFGTTTWEYTITQIK
jgi:hypothetical protein